MQVKNPEKWTHPRDYAGEIWPDYYNSGVGRSRDSQALERANFDAMLRELGGESETVIVVREGHWAVGWVEWIAIHESDEKALAIADEIKGKLEDYPVIDEGLWSEYEDEECNEVWTHCYNEHERAEYLRTHLHKVYSTGSSESNYSALRAAIKGSWGHAANMLPSPSDILS